MPEPLILNPADNVAILTEKGVAAAGHKVARRPIAKGDEVLDWREMADRYPKARQILQEGGDHALGNFVDYLPDITQFLQLR